MDLSDLLATKRGKNRFPAKRERRESREDFCFGLSPRHSEGGPRLESQGIASGFSDYAETKRLLPTYFKRTRTTCLFVARITSI